MPPNPRPANTLATDGRWNAKAVIVPHRRPAAIAQQAVVMATQENLFRIFRFLALLLLGTTMAPPPLMSVSDFPVYRISPSRHFSLSLHPLVLLLILFLFGVVCKVSRSGSFFGICNDTV